MNRNSPVGPKIEDIVWDRAALSGRQLIVLLAIARGVDQNGGRWSGYIQTQLANAARASRDQIEADLSLLQSNKFISVERSTDFAHIWICDPLCWVKGEQAR